VAVESCPQYFLLREDEVATLGGLRKFTPPARARSEADFDEMWTVLGRANRSTLCPRIMPLNQDQKGAASIWDVHFGCPAWTRPQAFLIDAALRGRLSLERIVELYATAPARTYGLRSKGQLRVGTDADFALVDAAADADLKRRRHLLESRLDTVRWNAEFAAELYRRTFEVFRCSSMECFRRALGTVRSLRVGG